MTQSPDTPPARQIYTVSALNRAARGLLEGGLPLVWLEGEISNLARPVSGHLYFSLKDAAAQVRCALFRNRAALLRFQPGNGMQVLVRARVSLYEPRGDFQLQIEHMEDAGHGALQRAFEALKQKLAAEGLFDAAHKQPLPPTPRRIGVITSPSGAAIHDILNTIRRRYPIAHVILYPVPVQGDAAAEKIVAMLHTASVRAECDVLIVARGGGSLEDLWAFNKESVARAIFNCTLPVISGIGHEIDFTIADFVADARAETPTGAAERATPDAGAWRRAFAESGARLAQTLLRLLATRQARLDWCGERLDQLHPSRLLRDRAQRLDELEARLGNATRLLVQRRGRHLGELVARMQPCNPAHRLPVLAGRLRELRQQLGFAARTRIGRLDVRLGLAARALHAVSPLATLSRGYAIVSSADGDVVTSTAQLHENQALRVRLHSGSLGVRVTELDQGEEG
ncbi:MAG TPA: exodeoxyribonuclease VII large subunit [Gammaproteobacteria bacterium]|nr:exodeoxyribonuclease VII large subunit [Gammaproteobacteria bacterium]